MDALMESTSSENTVTPPKSVKIVDAEEKFLVGFYFPNFVSVLFFRLYR